MAVKWISSKFKGVRYYEHKTRRHGVVPDKYFSIRYQFDGKRQEEGLGWGSEGWTAKKAFLLLSQLKEAAKQGKGAARLAEKREIENQRKVTEKAKIAAQITLADALDRYEREVSIKKKSHTMEKCRISIWKKNPLSSRYINTLKGYDFAKYRDERLAKGKANNTVRLELAIISHLFTIAQKEWGIEVANPVKAIRMPSPGRARDRRLRAGEEEKLIEACRKSRSAGLLDVVIIALETAMRQAEILGLEWKNVFLGKKTVYLPDTKNGTSREVPLSPVAIEVLRKRQKVVTIGCDKVFYEWKSTNGFKHTWRRAAIKAKIDNFRFHDLRHEATSRFFEKGLNIMEVAAITGHKDLKMLRRYTHLKAADLALKLDRAGG